MGSLDKTALEILNATADDCENLEQIYRQVCFAFVPAPADGGANGVYRPREGAPSLGEIAGQVHQLVRGGLLTVVMDEDGRPWGDLAEISYVWRGWFRMTDRGTKALQDNAEGIAPLHSKGSTP